MAVFKNDEIELPAGILAPLPDNEEPMALTYGGALDTVTVAQLTQSILPNTWRNLAAASWYGLAMLNYRIDVAKSTKLPQATADADETTYSALLKDYISKVAALEIVPAGIEYWMGEKISMVATGTSEVVSFTDRVKALQATAEALAKQIAVLEQNPNILPLITNDFPDTAGLSPADDNAFFVTADPKTMMPVFHSPYDYGQYGTELMAWSLPSWVIGLV